MEIYIITMKCMNHSMDNTEGSWFRYLDMRDEKCDIEVRDFDFLKNDNKFFRFRSL
jgi:hypothetical protein